MDAKRVPARRPRRSWLQLTRPYLAWPLPARLPLTLPQVVLLLVALLGLAGCSPRREVVDSPHFDISEIPLSAELMDAVAEGRTFLREPEPDNTFTRDLNRYTELVKRIHRPATRQAAGDELYDLWRETPAHFLWIDAAIQYKYLIPRAEERNAMLALPVLADTATTLGAFVQGRLWYRRGSRGEHYRRAGEGLAHLNPWQQIWLARKLAQIDSDQGDSIGAGERLLEQLPACYAVGGGHLASFLWERIALFLSRADRLDDALHAAVLGAEMARKSGSEYRACEQDLRIAEVLLERREYRAALDLLEACARAAEERGYTWLLLRSLNRQSATWGALGETQQALAIDLRNVWHSIAAGDSINTPRNLVNVAYDFRLLGELDSCRVFLDRARVWVDAFDNRRNKARLPFEIAAYYCQIGDYATADSLLAAATGHMSGATLAGEEADLLLELIKSGLEMGQPDLAYRAIARLRELRQVFHDELPDQNLLAEFEIATADFLAKQGEFLPARQALDRARRAVQTRGGEGMEWEYERSSGELALLRGDYLAASEAFSRCLALATAAGNPDQLATTRFHLGHILLREERFESARDLFHQQEADETFGARFRTRFSSRLFLGVSYSREGRHQEALTHFRRAEQLVTRHSPPDIVARLHIERGRSLAAVRQPRPAEKALLEALSLLRQEGGRQQIAELRAFSGDAFRDVTEALIGLYADMPGLLGDTDPGRFTLLLAEENRWGAGGEAAPAATAQTALDRLIAQPGSPLLAFFIGQSRSFLWVGAAGTVSLHPLPGRQELLGILAPVLSDMDRPDRPVEAAAAAELGRLLLEPLAALWQAGRPLRIIPDDVLFATPWSGLALPPDESHPRPRAVVEHGAVVEAPALLDFGLAPGDFSLAPGGSGSETVRPAGPSRLLLAVGLDSGTGGTGGEENQLRLRHAEAEAAQVAALWPAERVVLKVGEEAAWDRIAATALDRFGVIHIASHAVVHQGLPARATLRLAGGDEPAPLTITSVAALKLDADLIYLSCCEAARRVSRPGAGLMNFARAFLRAGSRSVIASTIRVDDEASHYLAGRYYHHWLAGKNKAAALRAAQLDLRAADPRWRHPYFWAFYRLIGQEG